MAGLDVVDKFDFFLKENIKIVLDARAKPEESSSSNISMFDKKDIDYLFEDEYSKMNFSLNKDSYYIVEIFLLYESKKLLIERWTFSILGSVRK